MQYKRRKIPQILRTKFLAKNYFGIAICRVIGHFLLLEVLIAFALVVLAVLPLIYPHYYIYQQQRAFIHKIDLDITVNLIYATILEQLHKNEISWIDIEQQRIFPIDARFLEKFDYKDTFPYEGSYQFHLLKTKKNPQYALNKVALILKFSPKGKKPLSEEKNDKNPPLTYTYDLFIAHQLKNTAQAVAP